MNEKHKGEQRPLETNDARGKRSSPHIGEAPFLFLEGSGGRPLSCLPVPPWRSLVPPRRSRALLLMNPQRAPPCPPRELPPRPPLRPMVTGVGDSTSRGGLPPVVLFFLL
jgi:hypothetical protein